MFFSTMLLLNLIPLIDVTFSTPTRTENADAHFEQLLDTDEAAALLKIHPKTLQQNGP
jgi:hypothetical protein